jgi:hypothetical protein
MSTWKRTLPPLLACALLWSGAPNAGDRATLVVRVYEAPTVSSQVMGRSCARVEALLAHAAVDVIWQHCFPDIADPACDGAPQANEVVVRLVSGVLPAGAHACGVALVPRNAPGHFISLFPDCVHASADELRVGDDVVLGCSLVHEIGHQLLGPQHAALGLMQAQPRAVDWARAAHDGLVFTPAESRRLREALVRRASLR